MSTIRKNIPPIAENSPGNFNMQKPGGISSLSSLGESGDRTANASPMSSAKVYQNEYAAISSTRGNPNSNKRSMKSKIIISVLIVVLFGIGGAWFVMARSDSGILSPLSSENSSEQSNNAGSPGNENLGYENPINGLRFSESDASKFKDIKPIAVMVNNYVEARPSFGLSQADIVYEAVAEAGITRLMPIFYSRIPEKVESIRSARVYFAELAAPYHPHFIHWGAAHVPPCQKLAPGSAGYCAPVGGKVETDPKADAYDRIVQLGLPNLDGGNYAGDSPKHVFSRNQERIGKVAIEHTAFVRLPSVYELAKQIRPDAAWHKFTTFKTWKFKDEAALSDRGDIGAAAPITYKYSDTMSGFDVKWTYDKNKNEYTRYQGGVKQSDALFNKDLAAKVVIVRLTVQTTANDKKNHLFHQISGSGKALIFQDGKVIDATWSRLTPEDMDVYKDSKGNEIEFTRGQIWVQVVPSTNKVEYMAPSATTPTATSTVR